MTTIGELVTIFVTNTAFTEWDRAIAQKWIEATRCSELDVRLLVGPKGNLCDDELKKRDEIKERTLEFARRYFDDRPNVVRSLDTLFTELGLSSDQARRREFFPFDKVYSHDEVIVLLLKNLQPIPGRERYTRERIAEYFLTTDRTINKRIGEMQPMVDPELSAKVFGQVVQMNPARGTSVPESTTHPLFLPLNMLELYTLVDMLIRHADDEVEGRIVRSILKCVLDQTTEYAEERLTRIAGFNEAVLSASRQGMQQGPGEAVMFSEKEGIRAAVRYMKEDKEETCTGRISRNHRDRAVVDVVANDCVCHIPYQNIIELKPARE